jgi:cyclopropane fatty-acyl-phospholipid synthase-like methyltransferase
MNNSDSLKYWEIISKKSPSKLSSKVNTINDHTDLDVQFILKFVNSDTEMLDLASGSGLTINRIYKYVKSITAIEKYPEFSKHISKSKKIKVINQDIKDFECDIKFDLITMFGIVSYFNEDEITDIYSKYKNNLNEKGSLIIKNQFGINNDVIISGFSDELKTEYYSQYRQLLKEIAILEKVGYKKIEFYDIYPEEYNRWRNTHFYSIVAYN